MTANPDNVKIVAQNRRARHDFYVEDTYEAGMELVGTEVKSLRQGTCSLAEGYARPRGQEIYLYDVHIPPYEQASTNNHEPTRPRKLLLHRREINRIIAQCTRRGCTLVPLRVYFKGGHAKVQIGLARRKRHWDKRDKAAAKQRRKDLEQDLRRR